MSACKLFFGDLHEWFEKRMAGIGGENIEPVERLDGLVKEPSHLALPGDVRGDGSRRAAPRDAPLDDVERLGRALRVVDHDRCAVSGETFGGRPAYASRRPRDDRYLPFEWIHRLIRCRVVRSTRAKRVTSVRETLRRVEGGWKAT